MAAFTCADVQLREMSGDDFTTLAPKGLLTIKGSPPAIDVDGVAVPILRGHREPFRRIGRDFQFPTAEGGFFYVSLPKGLQDAVYDRLEECLNAMVANKPIPAASGSVAKAAAAAAPAAAAAAEAAKPAAAAAVKAAEGAAEGAAKAGAGFFDALKELGAKAAADTAAMAAAIKAKAEHDLASLQEGNKPAQQGA